MKDFIEKLYKQNKVKIEKIDQLIDNGFDPDEASGGNFDDAYQLGHEHGFEYGKHAVLLELLKEYSKPEIAK